MTKEKTINSIESYDQVNRGTFYKAVKYKEKIMKYNKIIMILVDKQNKIEYSLKKGNKPARQMSKSLQFID